MSKALDKTPVVGDCQDGAGKIQQRFFQFLEDVKTDMVGGLSSNNTLAPWAIRRVQFEICGVTMLMRDGFAYIFVHK